MKKSERVRLEKQRVKLQQEINDIDAKLNAPEQAGWTASFDGDGNNEIYIGKKQPSWTVEIGDDMRIYIIDFSDEPDALERLNELAKNVRLVPVMLRILAENGLTDLLPE